MIRDSLGDRMKTYESVSDTRLSRLTPVILRLDGRAFHTLTKPLAKPFDGIFMAAMDMTLEKLCKEIPGCRMGYVQSDEISLLLLEKTLQSDAWFENRVQKIVSIAASIASTAFRSSLAHVLGLMENRNVNVHSYDLLLDDAVFDCRAFNIPERDVCNYFIWRQKDCYRNAVLTMAQHHIGKKAIYGMTVAKLTETLHGMGFTESDIPSPKGRVCIRDLGILDLPGSRDKWTLIQEAPDFRENREFIELRLVISEGDTK